jgi:hypothetical protein
MCFNNSQQPSPPQIAQATPPPPVKPLQEAQTSQLPIRDLQQKETKPVAYGAKSQRLAANKRQKRDSASLLVPLADSGNKPGGLNA